MIRVRFAPSPTGYLHIGGARTCLFNWLFVKHTSGKFILRIEDTDKARSTKEYLDEILESLKWLGFNWDEIYYQSQRFGIYSEHAQKLLQQGKAYQEGPAIILKMPPEEVVIEDLIRGNIVFDTSTIKDQVLIKSDASPTYNFACVIDDALMNITHIIRGEDHISNTPKQIIIYKALGFSVPKFAHLPLILDKEGGRMSKRSGATAVTEYRRLGYLPEAIVNFLMLLGWSPGDNREIISLDEAVKLFDITKVNKTGAVFNIDKLNWVNAQYIRQNITVDHIVPFLKEAGLLSDDYDRQYVESVLTLVRERLTTLKDIVDVASFFFVEEVVFDKNAKEEYLTACLPAGRDLSKEFLLLADRVRAMSDFSHQEVEKTFRSLVEELGLKVKDIIHPVRVALTGKTIGPGLFELMSVLGKERIISRLKRAADLLKQG